MTISAAIPSAVMAFALLRPLKGTILEVNIGMFEFPPVIPGLLLWLFIALLIFYITLRELFNKES